MTVLEITSLVLAVSTFMTSAAALMRACQSYKLSKQNNDMLKDLSDG